MRTIAKDSQWVVRSNTIIQDYPQCVCDVLGVTEKEIDALF